MDDKLSVQEVEYSEQETKKRADAALRIALATPPKPHKPLGKHKSKKKAKPNR